MQHMQNNYQENMSDIMTSFNFINQLQQSLHFIQQDASYLEPIMINPDPFGFDSSLSSINKLHSNNNNNLMNSYHISPSFTVVPPIHQTLENASITFDISLAEQQEMELQKNLVKDVFFSPAMMDSSQSSVSDDCHSLMSDTTTTSSCQYEQDEFLANTQDQVLFFYGLDLATTAEYEDTPKSGLGTSSPTITTANNRRTKQQMVIATKKKYTKTCNHDIKALTKRPLSTSKYVSKNNRNISSDLNQVESSNYNSQKNNVISAWEYNSDNSDTDHTSMSLIPNNKPRFISSPSIYQKLSKQNIDWCRYCGTTEGVNWRPGPWGKRTLCNKHGCDYKGYGFACKLPRLDLTSFTSETIDKRSRPVLQLFCSQCQCQESWSENVLVLCDGCPKAYHQACYHEGSPLTDAFIKTDSPWYCSEECQHNLRRKRVIVELPRKRLPLMRTPKNAALANNDTISSTRLPRSSLREN
ncbi:hypothetical protein MFLAVUS_009791 [Mucor flavus]|uniref:Zinc finger PHD-type domain-containing protein n=1 Tax=Mucor flavus TaxID=439312 RepID=A0ABP9ZAW9_9FUNG